MKLTNQEIIDMANALKSLGDKDLPILIAYKVIDNFDKLVLANSACSKALGKAKDENEIVELLNIEKEVKIEKIDKQELIEAGITLSPNQLACLKRLIDG